ncbi:MAG: hypothetical protein ACI977_000117 [Candidatus Nanohaloarchaea archaeon]|jgi:hypothetical protein
MSEEKASIVTYNTKREKFESMYERNQFYRGLFGYKQTVKRNGKEYKYEKEGLMDKIPNMRIDDSVFIIAQDNTERIKEYFHEWDNKISHHIFTVLISEEQILNKIRGDKNDDRRQS